MKKKQFDLREVRNIINLTNQYGGIEYDGLVLVDPEKATNLLGALKQYPTVFELEIGRLESQLRREEEAKEIAERLIIERNPIIVIATIGMPDIGYRKQCVEFYESLSD